MLFETFRNLYEFLTFSRLEKKIKILKNELNDTNFGYLFVLKITTHSRIFQVELTVSRL